MVGADQKGLELGAPPDVAADSERAERIAVIALPSRDDVSALRLADLDKKLPRHFERGFHRLRTAAHQIDVAQARRSVLDQPVGEAFGGLGGEESGMRIGEGVELFVHRGEHVRVPMAKARDGRAARRVEVPAPVSVKNLDPRAENRDWHVYCCGAVKYICHGGVR